MGKSLTGKELGRGITQRKDGRYQIYYRNRFKKRAILYARTEEEAREKLIRATGGEGTTLRDWHDIWEKHLSGNLRDTTRRTYDVAYMRLGALHTLDITKITRMDIQTVLNDMETDQMRKTSKEVLSILMNSAVAEGIISSNPAKRCKWRLVGEIKEERRILTAEDEEALDKVIPHDGSFYLFFRLALETGMRIGEIHGLCMSDIDFAANLIRVRHTLAYIPGHYVLHPPKSASSVRDIPMSMKAREVLLQAIKRREAINIPEGEFSDLVIVSRTGRPIDEANTKKMLETYSKKAGVPYVTPHGLRHTFATRCIARGMKPKVLQKILGHASIQLTMDLYCHVEVDTMRDEMSRIFQMA